VPIGIASNSPRALVEAALDAAGLDGPFDVILGVDDVRRPKPDVEVDDEVEEVAAQLKVAGKKASDLRYEATLAPPG